MKSLLLAEDIAGSYSFRITFHWWQIVLLLAIIILAIYFLIKKRKQFTNARKTILLNCLAGILTFLLVYSFFNNNFLTDLATTMLPGWHFSIYPFPVALYLAFVFIVASIIINLLFRYILRLMTYLWVKIFGVK